MLIDAAGSQPQIVSQLTEALAGLAPNLLHATDNISIYVADCKMYRTLINAHASAEDVRSAVQRALRAVHPAMAAAQRSCDASFRLFDFSSYMFRQMADLPGRKVALVISGGHEGKSKIRLAELSRLAGRYAIAVFGIRDAAERDRDPATALNPLASAAHYREQENPFDLLCASNGGLVFEPAAGLVDAALARLFYLLRARYILEFPAPDRGVNGVHGFEVSIKNGSQFLVRSAGASASIADPSLASDPNVIPTKASPAIFGPHHPLDSTKR